MKQFNTFISVCTFIMLCGTMAIAQGFNPQDGDFSVSDNLQFDTDKKMPGWIFKRPDKDNASEQLKHSEELEVKGSLRAARKSYNALVHQWHDTPEAVQAQLRIAYILYDQSKYKKSFKEFQYLVNNYAGQFKYNEVIEHQIKIANYIVGDKWGDVLFLPGFDAPERALPMYEQIILNAPNLQTTPGIRLKVGRIYEELKQYDEAIAVYDKVQQYHAQSDESEIALFRKANCLYTLSKKAPRDEKRCRLALSALSSFLSRHKMSPNRAEAEAQLEDLNMQLSTMYYNRALFYDKSKKRPESALIAYRDYLKKFPASESAQDVYARVVELESQIKE